jgi:hypothetical protein
VAARPEHAAVEEVLPGRSREPLRPQTASREVALSHAPLRSRRGCRTHRMALVVEDEHVPIGTYPRRFEVA